MVEKIEEEDLTVEQFNKLIDSQNKGQVEATEEELESFNNAVGEIRKIHMEYQEVITETIAKEGITPAKYQEIITGYQQNPELQARINEILEEIDEE